MVLALATIAGFLYTSNTSLKESLVTTRAELDYANDTMSANRRANIIRESRLEQINKDKDKAIKSLAEALMDNKDYADTPKPPAVTDSLRLQHGDPRGKP